ncbi:MAG: ATP-binding protein [Verrucomicrobiota bacterium]
MQEAELKAMRNKALEYKAWFLSGNVEKLEHRMAEQSGQKGDLLFVHINGEGVDYVNFTTDDKRALPIDDLHDFDAIVEGNNIPLGGQKWTIVSVPVGRDDLVLQAGKNSRALEETLSEFRRKALFLLIPGSLLALAAGIYFTFKTLSPTRRLIQTMDEILQSGDLSQRARATDKKNELNALGELFNQLLGRNEKLITAMSDSLDHVAHDLGGPLTRLKMTIERAMEREKDPDRLLESLGDCAEEVDYLERLLTVLMDVAEAESGALRLKKESLRAHELMSYVVESYELVAEDRRIDLKTHCPEEVRFSGDRTRLAQALANLLDNALKFSPAGSEIALNCYQDQSELHFSVTDQGPGIREENVPHIWDRLFRADPSRSTPGMGLGLSLVKAIVEAHGGRVDVQSRLGKGSTFTISLPYS